MALVDKSEVRVGSPQMPKVAPTAGEMQDEEDDSLLRRAAAEMPGDEKFALDELAYQRLQNANVRANDMKFLWMDPRHLRPHGMNPKRHTSVQRRAFEDFAAEFGWLGALLYNKRTGTLLDGHLRLQSALEQNVDSVPVLVVDIPEANEAAVLTLLDPIGAMYGLNKALLAEVSQMVETKSETLKALLAGAEMAEDEDNLPQVADETTAFNDVSELPEGGMSLVLGEMFDTLHMLFTSEFDWVAAQDVFGLTKQRCVFHSTLVGMGRVVNGSRIMERFQKLTRDNASLHAQTNSLLRQMKAAGLEPEIDPSTATIIQRGILPTLREMAEREAAVADGRLPETTDINAPAGSIAIPPLFEEEEEAEAA